jgi:Ring finger domain
MLMERVIAELRSRNEVEQQCLEIELKTAKKRNREQESPIQQLLLSRGNINNTRSAMSPEHSSSSTYQSSRPSSSRAPTSSFDGHSPSLLPSYKAPISAFNSSASRLASLHNQPHGPLPPPFDYDGLSYALRLQREFDAEDRALTAQRTELSKSAQRLFECGICMDEMPEDSIARPDSCGHSFCRECLRGHVSARLEERRFPILCPTCTAGKGKGKGVTGGTWQGPSYNRVEIHVMSPLEISQSIALNLGLTEQQYNIWTEMEMVAFSVLLSCRKQDIITSPFAPC